MAAATRGTLFVAHMTDFGISAHLEPLRLLVCGSTGCLL